MPESRMCCADCVNHYLAGNGSFACGCHADLHKEHGRIYCSRLNKKTLDARACAGFVWNEECDGEE